MLPYSGFLPSTPARILGESCNRVFPSRVALSRAQSSATTAVPEIALWHQPFASIDQKGGCPLFCCIFFHARSSRRK